MTDAPLTIPKLREVSLSAKPLRRIDRKYVADLTGKRFGKLLVRYEAPRRGRYTRMWLCTCDCGADRVVNHSHLQNGNTRSCGSKSCKVNKGTTTHGQARRNAGTTEYRIWRSMKTRCDNPAAASFKHYGGRGIVVCTEWNNSFERFLADMGPRPSPEHTLDRIDTNGPYSRANCQWATLKQQVENKRNRIWLIYQGKSMLLVDAAKIAGVKYRTAVERFHRGVPIDRRARG